MPPDHSDLGFGAEAGSTKSHMQRSHRRSTKVCTRCKKRKTKCDFKFPACTPCKLANAACFGFDPATREAVPRSLVKSLEGRVAELEAQVLAFQVVPQNVPNSMASIIGQATISYSVPSSSSYLHSRVSSGLIFRPSCPPLAILRDLPWGRRDANGKQDTPDKDTSIAATGKPPGSAPHSRPNSNTVIDLSSVPSSAIKRMVQNYAETHQPQYPCVSQAKLANIVERTQNQDLGATGSLLTNGIAETAGLGHFEYFILFIALALSTMTLTWKAEEQARSASESFYNSALMHLHLLEVDSDIEALQVSLLLAHYAHMRPERVDNWTCIANAVRITLALGLFQEPPPTMDPEQASQRSELFWVAYGMERSLCASLRLPLSFPEEAITTKWEVFADEPSASGSPTLEVGKKSSANQIRKYRALETEVHRVMHLGEDLTKFGSATMDGWIQDVDGRLQTWYAEAKGYSKHGMLEFKPIQFYQLRARLYRSTPRLRTRTPEDRCILLESAREVIQDYVGQEQRRRLFYPWHAVQNLFETAVVTLDACWESRDWQPHREQTVHMLQVLIPQCLGVISNIGERWSGATACAERLKPMAQQISSALLQGNSNASFLNNDLAITQDIQSLLFSEGPPMSANQLDLGLGDGLFGFDNVATMFDDDLFADVELFHWDPEWGILPPEQEFGELAHPVQLTPCEKLDISMLTDLTPATDHARR